MFYIKQSWCLNFLLSKLNFILALKTSKAANMLLHFIAEFNFSKKAWINGIFISCLNLLVYAMAFSSSLVNHYRAFFGQDAFRKFLANSVTRDSSWSNNIQIELFISQNFCELWEYIKFLVCKNFENLSRFYFSGRYLWFTTGFRISTTEFFVIMSFFTTR